MPSGRFILRQVARDLRLRPGGVLLTMLACFFALSQFSLTLYTLHLARQASRMPQAASTMVAYIEGRQTMATIQALKQKIAAHPEVDSVKFIPRSTGLARLQQWLGTDNPLIEGLDADLLPDAFELRLEEPHHDEARRVAASIRDLPQIEDVRISSGLWQRLLESYRLIRWCALITASLAILCLGLVIFLSIRIEVFACREQVEVLRLLGADRVSLYTPHIVTAGLHGLVASILSLVVLKALIGHLTERIPTLLSVLFVPDFAFGLQVIGFAVCLSVLSAFLAVRVSRHA